MLPSPVTKAYLQIHLCVMLWGFTAIFGRLISIDALAMVWWRMLIVAVTLLLVPCVWRELRHMSVRLIGAYAGIGLLLATHWLLFYGAIKLANASVGAICLAVAPVFVAFIEPHVVKRPFHARELLLGIGVIPGVALIVGGIPAGMYLGFACGLVSAVFVAAFSTFNKRMVEGAGPLTVVCIEMASGAVFLTLLAPLLPHTGAALPLPDWNDTWLLLAMSLGCTVFPFVLLLKALRHVSAFGVGMTTNLEPIYAIVLAIPLLGEQLQVGLLFYVGVAVVIGTVIAHPFVSRYYGHKRPSRPLAAAHARNAAP